MNKNQCGSLNLNWKGGRIKKDGYVMVHAPEHLNANERGYVYEHRFVMSGLINRALYPDEDVHHIDENRSNNDPSNLMLIRHCDHMILHNTGSKLFTDIEKMDVEIKSQGFYAKKRIGRSKLTDDQWKELYADYASGIFFIKDLVKKYGISQAMIPRGLKARGYKIRQHGGGRKSKKSL